LGLAGDVRRRELAVGCLFDAFEAGCGKGARNRGAVFTVGVRGWKRAARVRAAAQTKNLA
jgi:hypothetical protein